MRILVRALLLLSAWLLLRAAPVWAGKGQQEGLVEASVSTSEGRAAASATVTLRGEGLVRGQAVTTTDEGGRYRFVDLAPGSYEIEVDLPGVGASFDVVDVHIGERVS